MERNFELIRKIALAIEKADGTVDSSQLSISGTTPAAVSYHCALMNEDGLFKAIEAATRNDPECILITRLTSKGHDFVDAARNERFQ